MKLLEKPDSQEISKLLYIPPKRRRDGEGSVAKDLAFKEYDVVFQGSDFSITITQVPSSLRRCS